MHLEIKYKDSHGETTIYAHGWLLGGIINFSNSHDFIKAKVKTKDRVKRTEYYPPEYLNKKPKKEKKNK